jgi:hypothetical protein
MVEQVIELDDAGSDQASTQDRERLVAVLLKAAGIRLERVDVHRVYTVGELATLVGVADSE